MAPMQYYLPVALWPGACFATVNLLRSQGMFYELSAFIGTSQHFLNIAGQVDNPVPQACYVPRTSTLMGLMPQSSIW